MHRHFEDELQDLRKQLIFMSQVVQEAIEVALESLFKRDVDLAREVITDYERKINRLEIQIDDRARSLFLLQQPVGHDMRFVASVLKINTDLERMGDHAVNIAERALEISCEPEVFEDQISLKELSDAALKMLRSALQSFVLEDVASARQVLHQDDEVDDYNDSLYDTVVRLIQVRPEWTKIGMSLVMVGHNLERIADLASNIAEDVIYMRQGKEVRHHME